MSKRRRTSSIASRGQDDDFEDTSTNSGPTIRKKRKSDPSETCQHIYDLIRNYKKQDGGLLCDSFIRAPKRRQEPGYYDVVSNPIDMLKIQQKLKTDEYEDPEELTMDVELMIKNAKAFYKKSSQEYKDACDLWELFLSTKTRMVEEEEAKVKVVERRGRKRNPTLDRSKSDIDIPEDISESSTNPDDDYSQYEDLFTAVMMATDAENRPLHVVFQLLPSKKKYPEYYEVIENPIDLKTIAQKIQNSDYNSLIELEKDLILLCRNACLFNEPGSQIYKDAKALKKVITSKKIEVEHGKLNLSGKSSERIRNKRMRGGVQTLSAVTAALKDDESETDMEDQPDEDVDLYDPEDPMWQLFAAVRNTVSASGAPMSDPFWKLPSKRYYPDYYKEIKNPVSLSQIRTKLKKGDYGTVSEVAGDMNIMFENAKKYNVHTSKLYKDAAKLQKIMQAKVQELLDIDQDSDSDAESEDSRGLKRRKRQTTPITAGRKGPNVSLKRRLHAISKSLIDYTCEEGRQPMLLFMEKPSKKLYPDYYQVIAEPIDVLTIESNIKNEKYQSEEELIADFKLMFANCRHYNEEGSMIYNDANLLEKVLMEKANIPQPTPTPEPRKYVARTIKPRKILTPDEQKLRALYDTIRDFREPKSDRQLALIFMKLPSKNDYPDYYEVIKEPIDMEMIAAKLKSSLYENLDKLVADYILMFDNACKYNEPDSQIYKDALILQRVCLQTKQKLRENDAEDHTPPDVQGAVQDLLATLFTSVYNHQDDEGRCYSDSMAELPEHDEVDGKKVRALSLDLIKRRLDRGVYRRLDTFQDDFFACLDRARRLSRTDSQVFEDSIELQSYFIRQRDEVCGCGDLLQSPALSYSISDLIETIDKSKRDKIKQEIPDEEGESTSTSMNNRTALPKENVGDSMTCNQRTFRVGEFVYIDSKEKGVEPSIILIERLWTNSEGQQMLYGNYFLRPGETYHVTTRRFLENEVFKSDAHVAAPLNEVKDRCCVLNIKDYIKMKPEGYVDKDVYVCESRYSTKARSFKKIKVWPVPEGVVNLVERPEPFELRRVMSVFRERVEKHKDELAELAEQETLVEREKPNVVAFNMMGQVDDGNVYYEQYNTICSGVVKTGDFVYVATEDGRQLIAQIDAIWETKCGKCYYRGPWLIPPAEIPHLATRVFYRQEVFLSTTESVSPLVGIVGKCSVLEYTDYISCRVTEIPESDVYVCESLYDEVKRTITKLSTEGLKRYSHSPSVTDDETYFFRRLINPQKETFEVPPGLIIPPVLKVEPVKLEIKNDNSESSPATPKIQADVDMMEDSLDGGPPSVGSGEIPTPISSISTPISGMSSTPVSAKKQKVPGKKIVTGYILYSSEVRKTVAQNNPDSGFGEISRIVGNEWRSLPAGEKQSWEEKAQKINEEAANEAGIPVVRPPPPPTQPPDFVFECQWDECDLQFEDLNDCLDHCVQEGAGHIQQHFQGVKDPEFQCHWRGCIRIKKQAPSFPHLQRLARHVREVHIMKGNGRVIPAAERSKNFVPSKKQAAAASQQAAANAEANKTIIHNRVQQGISAHYAQAAPPRPVEPLFITVPPRPTRILHSEAYIKYIEGLQATNKFMSPWEKTLNASEENTPVPDSTKLPGHWLANGERNHASLTSALWSLRDLMMHDIMNLAKN